MPLKSVSGPILLISRFLLVLLLLGSTKISFAQQFLLAQKAGNDVVYMMGKGAVIRVSYQGYAQQVQEIKGKIIDLTKDTICLREEKLIKPDTFRVAVKDILGVRHYTLARTISKSMLELGLVAGNIAFYHAILVPSILATGPVILIGVGTSLVSYGLIKIIFPDQVTRTKSKGWDFKVVTRMPGTPAL